MPREAARLQGFPDDFKIPVSDNQAYQQFGNSVPVKVVEKVAEQMLKHIKIATEKLTIGFVKLELNCKI